MRGFGNNSKQFPILRSSSPTELQLFQCPFRHQPLIETLLLSRKYRLINPSNESDTGNSNFSVSFSATSFPSGSIVACRKRRHASRAAVPWPSSASSTGTPQQASMVSPTDPRIFSRETGGSAPIRFCCQSWRGAAAIPSPHPSAVVGTSKVRPWAFRRSFLRLIRVSPSAP